MGIHMASLTSLVGSTQQSMVGRVSLAAGVPFSLQAMPLFWERQGIIPFPAGSPEPQNFPFLLAPLARAESYFALLCTPDWMVSLAWWTGALSLTAESLPYMSFSSGFFILPFGLAWLSSHSGSLLACFCFLQQFPKQHGRSSTVIAAPTPELCFN